MIVTSRLQLGGLVTAHGARPLALDVLNEAESRELLARRLGADRIAAEPEAVAELLAGCAGLPLALSIVAARAALHPALPLAVLAGELREASTRLGALDAGDIRASLAAVFSWSYQALDPQVAGVFRLLGLAPGPDISLPAAASLTGLPTTQTGAVLRALERVSLLQQHTPGRYRMHDLVKLYAADQARHQSNDSRDTALRRLVDFYLHTAYAGERLLEPHRPPIEINPSVAGCHLHPVPDQAAAWTWLETEHPCLLATQHLAADQGWHSTVWQLAWTLNTFHYRRGHLQDQLVAWQAGLAAAQRGGDAASLLRARQTLGHVCARVGRHADALDHLSHALDLAQNTGDLLHQATTHQALAGTWELEGDDQRALQHATSALHLCQDLDDPMREADVLNAVGWFSARLGYYQQALIHCKAALTLHRHHHYREGEAATLDSLGYLAHRTGQHDQALDYYHQALTLFRDLGNTYREADILDHLGQTHAALGHHDQARHAWRQALELYQDQYRTAEADRIQQQFDDLTEPEREQREVFDKEG